MSKFSIPIYVAIHVIVKLWPYRRLFDVMSNPSHVMPHRSELKFETKSWILITTPRVFFLFSARIILKRMMVTLEWLQKEKEYVILESVGALLALVGCLLVIASLLELHQPKECRVKKVALTMMVGCILVCVTGLWLTWVTLLLMRF